MRLVALAIVVGIVAIFQMYVAVPIGLLGGLDRVSIIVATWIGGMIGVIAFVYFGPVIVAWTGGALRRVRGRPEPEATDDRDEESHGRTRQYAERLGAPFLGVVGPATIGGWAAAVLGASMGMSKPKLIGWLAVGQAIVTVAYVWLLKAAV
ncbi:MAG: hypothetical protein ACR2N6_07855 [Miltoncostaeaceae bacterium]